MPFGIEKEEGRGKEVQALLILLGSFFMLHSSFLLNCFIQKNVLMLVLLAVSGHFVSCCERVITRTAAGSDWALGKHKPDMSTSRMPLLMTFLILDRQKKSQSRLKCKPLSKWQIFFLQLGFLRIL